MFGEAAQSAARRFKTITDAIAAISGGKTSFGPFLAKIAPHRPLTSIVRHLL